MNYALSTDVKFRQVLFCHKYLFIKKLREKAAKADSVKN